MRDAAAADGTLASERFDLVLLDLGLPRGAAPAGPADGLEVLRALRARHDPTPVIVLTARDAAATASPGSTPAPTTTSSSRSSSTSSNARIRAVLRRHAGRAEPLLAHGGVTLDPATRRVTRDGVPVLLSAREFAVLEALLARPGAVLSRAQLEDRLYGWGEEIESNAVSVYIHQLRKKLGADFIRNVRGVGYFVAAGDAARARSASACWSRCSRCSRSPRRRWRRSPTATCSARPRRCSTTSCSRWRCRCATRARSRRPRPARWPTSSSTS